LIRRRIKYPGQDLIMGDPVSESGNPIVNGTRREYWIIEQLLKIQFLNKKRIVNKYKRKAKNTPFI
jgi:hypothetical protein